MSFNLRVVTRHHQESTLLLADVAFEEAGAFIERLHATDLLVEATLGPGETVALTNAEKARREQIVAVMERREREAETATGDKK